MEFMQFQEERIVPLGDNMLKQMKVELEKNKAYFLWNTTTVKHSDTRQCVKKAVIYVNVLPTMIRVPGIWGPGRKVQLPIRSILESLRMNRYLLIEACRVSESKGSVRLALKCKNYV